MGLDFYDVLDHAQGFISHWESLERDLESNVLAWKQKTPVDLAGIFEVKKEVGSGSLVRICSKYEIQFHMCIERSTVGKWINFWFDSSLQGAM